jgi:Fatty acid hydroxylase superfamily
MTTAVAERARGRARYSGDVTTLRGAGTEFLHRRSIWMILAVIAITAAVRVAIGDPSWRDAVAVATMLVVYPFGEWAIHVYVLHMKPFTVRGRRIDPPAGKGHRAHHRQPSDLWVLLLEAPELIQLMLGAVPFTIALVALPVWLLAGPIPAGVLVSGALAAYVLIGVYEWTHFLIHTAYRPRSRHYRAIWRNHRLHHFKNEHYWHGVTSNVSDRVLGTNPDQRAVSRSPTARDLGSGPTG